VQCPRCAAQTRLRRAADAHIDSAGFETYTLACVGCGSFFSGIIDPYDDALLVEDIN
jgi:hypothetical protein